MKGLVTTKNVWTKKTPTDACKLFLKHSKGVTQNNIKFVKKVHDGYTNVTFHLFLKNKQQFGVRLSHNKTGVNRHSELVALKSFAPNSLVYFDVVSGNAIKHWYIGNTIKRWTNKSVVELAATLKRLHQKKPLQLQTHDYYAYPLKCLPKKMQEKYHQLVKKHKGDPLVFCHNDLNKKNIIRTRSGLQLIDFEYARVNSIYFEVANLFVAGGFSLQKEKKFLTVYKKLEIKKIRDYKFISLCFGYAWASKLYNQKKASIYKTQAIRQLKQLLKK